jgi:hypothetical protein
MKTTHKILLCLIGIVFFSCNGNFNTGTQGSGNITKEKRDIIIPFEKIASSSGITVIVEQGSTASIEVETDDNIQQYVITKVENGTLVVKVEGSIHTESPINVSIKMPLIKGLESSSGSTISSKNTLRGTEISLTSSSGSEIEAVLEYEKVTCDSSSGSNITVSGKALNLQTSTSSGSEIDAEELAANEITADASSGSFTKVKPIVKLKGTASSGSSITYYQKPRTIIKEESSGGSVTFE